MYELKHGVYELLEGETIWLSQINLGIGREIGIYQGVKREWLYWYNRQGKRYLTSGERAIQAQERAKKLEAKLRSLGIDPDEL